MTMLHCPHHKTFDHRCYACVLATMQRAGLLQPTPVRR